MKNPDLVHHGDIIAIPKNYFDTDSPISIDDIAGIIS